MKILCRFCAAEFEGDGQTLSKEAMDHIGTCHPDKAKELQNGIFNIVKDYYIIQRG